MSIKVPIQLFETGTKIKIALGFVIALILAWLCYQFAYWLAGMGLGDFISQLRQDSNPYRMAPVDYGGLLLYGISGSLIGIAGLCFELLLNQFSVSGGAYRGIGLLLIVPIVLIFSLPVALILAVCCLVGGGYVPSWF